MNLVTPHIAPQKKNYNVFLQLFIIEMTHFGILTVSIYTREIFQQLKIEITL